MKYIYGPVKSRRLGLSLGINLTPYKTCTFDCVYCQLGKTTLKTSQRKEYLNISEVITELQTWLQINPHDAGQLNFITISGSGEPTLNTRIAELISHIKKIASVAVCVITNGSLLGAEEVRRDILEADVIIPSLDAATQEAFQAIDRPEEGASVENIIDGLVQLRKEFKGKIWLEVMLVKGINDTPEHIRRLNEALERIHPDKIQLNSPVRATAEENILPVEKKKLERLREMLGDKCEIV